MNYSPSFDPYKVAYSSMPSHASANPEIKQLYIDGHFCYAFKFGVVTNGLGIVRHIDFYNKDYFEKHPEIVIEKKSNSPDEDKAVHDSRLLIPTLKDMFKAHPLLNPKNFKTVYGLAGRKTQNEDTLHADLILSGITQLITVLLANTIKHPECIRTVKSFIA